MDKDGPDWDYAYAPPTSIARDRSAVERDRSSISGGTPWDYTYNNGSIVAPPSEQQSQSTTKPTSTRQMSRLEMLCANHECSIAQEPESLYYRTISTGRAKRRPVSQQQKQQQQKNLPPHRGRARESSTAAASTISRRRSHERNRIKLTIEQNLVESAELRKQQDSTHLSNRSPISGITFERQKEKAPPPRCQLPSLGPYFAQVPSTVVVTTPLSTTSTSSSSTIDRKTTTERKTTTDRRVTTPPISNDTTAAAHRSTRSEERISPTSVNDIFAELTDLQDQLDALRMTKVGISKTALVDAAAKSQQEELVELPKLDEELVDGVPFQAFESQRDVPDSPGNNKSAQTFSDLITKLNQHQPPVVEEAFVDPGVRVRKFDSEEQQDTRESSFSITMPPPRPHSRRNKTRVKIKSSTREAPSASSSSEREGPEAPPKQVPSPRSHSVHNLLGKKKKLAKSRSSSTSSQTPPSPRSKLLKADSFSLRKAIASVRGKSVPSSVLVTEATRASEEEVPTVKSVRFSKKLISSLHYRPKTLPHEVADLYFTPEELEQLERDREERLYEEQFEVVAGKGFGEVAVTYPGKSGKRVFY